MFAGNEKGQDEVDIEQDMGRASNKIIMPVRWIGEDAKAVLERR